MKISETRGLHFTSAVVMQSSTGGDLLRISRVYLSTVSVESLIYAGRFSRHIYVFCKFRDQGVTSRLPLMTRTLAVISSVYLLVKQ